LFYYGALAALCTTKPQRGPLNRVKKNDGQEVLRNFAQTIPDFINGIGQNAKNSH
jgi:hypothetical protein